MRTEHMELPFIRVRAEEGAGVRQVGFEHVIANTGLVPDVPIERENKASLGLLGLVSCSCLDESGKALKPSRAWLCKTQERRGKPCQAFRNREERRQALFSLWRTSLLRRSRTMR